MPEILEIPSYVLEITYVSSGVQRAYRGRFRGRSSAAAAASAAEFAIKYLQPTSILSIVVV